MLTQEASLVIAENLIQPVLLFTAVVYNAIQRSLVPRDDKRHCHNNRRQIE
ncbi:MAG: hypothetical protein JWR72_470 [Flavisolibacter sp.]|nr:hypothetical protein [Flavisolibacter sp.]